MTMTATALALSCRRIARRGHECQTKVTSAVGLRGALRVTSMMHSQVTAAVTSKQRSNQEYEWVETHSCDRTFYAACCPVRPVTAWPARRLNVPAACSALRPPCTTSVYPIHVAPSCVGSSLRLLGSFSLRQRQRTSPLQIAFLLSYSRTCASLRRFRESLHP
jgi:hypothetical protein